MKGQIKYIDGREDRKVEVVEVWSIDSVTFAYCKLYYNWGYDNFNLDRLKDESNHCGLQGL